MFTVKYLSSNILHLQFQNSRDMCDTLMRPQEYYENPELRGRVFTVGQLKQWYTNFYGAWTYADDWSGMNIPSTALKPFIDGLFEPLTAAEGALIELVRHKNDRYYIIATYDDSGSLDHEIAHALYYTNPLYMHQVDNLLATYFSESTHTMRRHLRSMGYHNSVINDELHAYLATDEHSFDELELPEPVDNLRSALRELYLTYSKELKL